MKLPRLPLIYCQCIRQSTCFQGTDGLMEEDYQVNGYCFRTALLGNVKVSYFSSEIHNSFPTVVVCPWLLMRGLISISILNLLSVTFRVFSLFLFSAFSNGPKCGFSFIYLI